MAIVTCGVTLKVNPRIELRQDDASDAAIFQNPAAWARLIVALSSRSVKVLCDGTRGGCRLLRECAVCQPLKFFVINPPFLVATSECHAGELALLDRFSLGDSRYVIGLRTRSK